MNFVTYCPLLDRLLTLQASSEDHKWSKIQPKERRGENSNVEEGKEESDSVNNTAVDNTATNVSRNRHQFYVMYADNLRQAQPLPQQGHPC